MLAAAVLALRYESYDYKNSQTSCSTAQVKARNPSLLLKRMTPRKASCW